MKKLTIAIDGHASTGKSSIAKELAKIYGYIYINSGSVYRAVTLFVIENELFDMLNEWAISDEITFEELKNMGWSGVKKQKAKILVFPNLKERTIDYIF